MTDEKPDPLKACEEKVEELAAENAELRESAESFGALAERLNQARKAEATSTRLVCPRCNRPEHVISTAPTLREGTLHCNYCGHTWKSPSTVGTHASSG